MGPQDGHDEKRQNHNQREIFKRILMLVDTLDVPARLALIKRILEGVTTEIKAEDKKDGN